MFCDSKKLEAENDLMSRFKPTDDEHLRGLEAPALDDQSIRVEVPPWSESYEISATDAEG